MADQSAGFTGSIPDNYDRYLGPVLFTDYGADLVRRVAAASPARVLETAAGTGIVTRMLRDALPAAEITATDLNPPMLDVARAKFRQGERITSQAADAGALPFPDGAFDAVACQFGIMFFPDKDKSYREVHRVLAPGGRYVFNVWDAHDRNPFAAAVAAIIRQRFPVDPPTFYEVPFGYHRLDPIKASLEAAGFRDIAFGVLRRDQPVANVRDFARGLVFGNPLIDQVRARRSIDPEALFEEVTAAIAPLFGNPPRARLQTIVVEAAKA